MSAGIRFRVLNPGTLTCREVFGITEPHDEPNSPASTGVAFTSAPTFRSTEGRKLRC